MTFHLIFDHIILCSVRVADWPLSERAISRFGFEGRIWVLIVAIPGHCIFVTCIITLM